MKASRNFSEDSFDGCAVVVSSYQTVGLYVAVHFGVDFAGNGGGVVMRVDAEPAIGS